MAELELKFRMPQPALASLAAALRARGAKTFRLRARYFDTADGLLARQRISLRLRLEGRHWLQTVKAEKDGVVNRPEHEVRVSCPPGVVPPLDLHRHDGTDAGKALSAALAKTAAAELSECYATDVQRLCCLLQDANGSAFEVALDIGQVTAPTQAAAIAELELEHKQGPRQGMFDLAAAWVQHGGLWLCAVTKAERGARLLAPAAPRAVRPRPTRLQRGADGAALLRAVLQAALEPVIGNVGEIAEGRVDVDVVHQARIGLRRLRTVLRELAALSPAISPQWDGALSAVFAKLGQQRDQEVVAEAVRPLLQAASAPLLTWRPKGSASPQDAVRDPAFQRTLLAILALVHADTEAFAALSASAALGLLAKRLSDLHQQVTQEGRHFEKLALTRQHRLRRRLKRLRYLSELTAPMWPRATLQRYLKRMSGAQDALGNHNDVAVAAAAFRADARTQPDAWFAAGYLQAHLAVTARAARKALTKIADAERFWD